jgi:Helicase HerA, central domain/Type IV secretion-system coupling protein DNA-binding domain
VTRADDQPTALLIVPAHGSTLDRTAFETLLQALALPTYRRPGWLRYLGWRRLAWNPRRLESLLALELVGSAQLQAFVVRIAHPKLLSHVANQLEARFPTAHIVPIQPSSDPLSLRAGEEVTVYALRPGGARTYLPLRVVEHHSPVTGQAKLDRAGLDPLLGLLATLSDLPEGTRVIFQLALSAAPEGWSLGHAQEADRYSLEQNRDDQHQAQQEVVREQQKRERREEARYRQSSFAATGASGEDSLPLGLLLLILGGIGLTALWRTHASGQRRPSWLPESVWQLWREWNSSGAVAPKLTLLLSHPTSYLPLLLLIAVGLVLLALGVRASLRVLGSALLPDHLRRRRRLRLRPSPIYDGELVQQKIQRIAYHSVLRLYAVSPRSGAVTGGRKDWTDWRQQRLDRAVAAYRQFHTANAGYFKPRHLWSWQARGLLSRHGRASGWTRGVRRSGYLLSVAEVATLWHLPQEADLAQIPFLQDVATYHSRLAPRAVATFVQPDTAPDMADDTAILLQRLGRPPTSLASTMPVADFRPSPGRGLVLGVSSHGGHQAEVKCTDELLGRHTLAIGGTGKGKSSLLLALARSWLEASFPDEPTPGLVLLDPHGDLAGALLQTLPMRRKEDVRVLDLADTDYPFALNPLDVTLGRSRDKACEDLMAIFQHIWESSWGYRMEDIWKAALKTLFEANETLVDKDPEAGPDQQYTLVDVVPLLSNKAFRRLALAHIEDPDLLLWWQRFATWDMRLQTDATLPVLNKVGNFGGSRVSRRILGQGRSTIDLAAALRAGQIVIVHTAPNIVGPDTGALVGATLLGLVQMALGAQAHLPREARRRTQVVIDEFQAIPGANYAGMLSELRKFGGVFVLATQTLAHLDRLGPTLRATVLGNISNLFAFGMSADDARKITPELDGTVTEQDLINLEDYSCYARLTYGGQRLRTFSLRLVPPLAGSYAQEESIRAHSRELVCRPQADVELDLDAAMQRRLFPHSSGIRSPFGIGRNGMSATGAGATSAVAVSRPPPGDGEPLPEDEPEEWLQEEYRVVSTARPTAEKKQAGDQEKPPVKRPIARRRSTAAQRQVK